MKRAILLLFALFMIVPSKAKVEEKNKGYRGYVDLALGGAYNLNTAQTISTNNMQLYTLISTTHGYVINNWFVGAGIGYYHSYRDNENIFPFYAAGRYTFENVKLQPFIEARTGIMFDPLWIQQVQAYGALSIGMTIYKGLQIDLRGSIFSRPSRFFTANAAVVIGYTFGK